MAEFGLAALGLGAVIASLAGCQAATAPAVNAPLTPSAPASPAAVAELPAFVAITPELHARLVPTVAEVRVREVRPVTGLTDRDMMGTPQPTGQAGRLVVMDLLRLLKPANHWSNLTTLIAIVPDALDPARLLPGGAARGMYAPGTEAVVFLSGYGGPGDADCATLRVSLDPNYNQVECGFALPYLVRGDKVLDPLTGAELPRADLEAAVERASRPRRPPLPDPWPQAWSMRMVDGIYLGIEGALRYGDAVIAEVEVLREGPPEYNTPTGAAPPGPPDETGTPHVDRDEWDIRQIVELKVHHVYAGAPGLMGLTDIVALQPGEPDNPYHPTSGFDPPLLPAGMRGVVAFDDQIWPLGDPTPSQRRALARVEALNAAGGRAMLLTAQPGAAVYFIGPYAVGDGGFRLIPDYRAELAELGR